MNQKVAFEKRWAMVADDKIHVSFFGLLTDFCWLNIYRVSYQQVGCVYAFVTGSYLQRILVTEYFVFILAIRLSMIDHLNESKI